MNKIFDIVGHRALWNWLADNPDKDKGDWTGWKKNGGTYDHAWAHCFACDYARDEYNEKLNCCPLIWSDTEEKRYSCESANAEYARWNAEDDFHDPELAREIANLPVRKGVVTNEIMEES